MWIFALIGTGGNPSLGEQAAEESAADLQTAVGNADMVSQTSLYKIALNQHTHLPVSSSFRMCSISNQLDSKAPA